MFTLVSPSLEVFFRTGKDYHGDIIEWIDLARKIKNGSSEHISAQGLAYALEKQGKKIMYFTLQVLATIQNGFLFS